MKRSKIFLGVTTCLLAVAGLSAAKRFGPNVQRWYVTVTNSTPELRKCITTNPTCVQTLLVNKPLAVPCTIAFSVGLTGYHRIVYTASDCINKVYYTKAN